MSQRNALAVSVEGILRDAGIVQAAREATEIAQMALRGHGGDWNTVALQMAQERARGVPLEYVVGSVQFMGLELMAQPGVLVPRGETEILGRRAVDLLRGMAAQNPSRELRVVDMCCGSGNLACAIATLVPSARVWASDLTNECVKLAIRNVAHLKLEDRVTVRSGDLFAGLEGLQLEQSVDAIVCNPPYISTFKLHKEREQLVEHEPREAFDGGPYGLTIHQRMIREAPLFLRAGGWLLFELGQGQGRQIELLFRRAASFGDLAWETDAQQQPRVVSASKKAGT